MLGPRRGPLSQSDLTTVSIVTDSGVVLPLERRAECDVLRGLQLDTQGFVCSDAAQVFRKNPIRILFKAGSEQRMLGSSLIL